MPPENYQNFNEILASTESAKDAKSKKSWLWAGLIAIVVLSALVFIGRQINPIEVSSGLTEEEQINILNTPSESSPISQEDQIYILNRPSEEGVSLSETEQINLLENNN